MDKIYAMKLFVRVAERESFSRAAEDVGLPKGSVSRQIQALENQLGTRLLHRTTRRVQLTQDGMAYYERAKDLLSNLDELEGLFQSDPASISGKIRIDIPPGLTNSLIMPRLPTFLHHYPGIALELCSSDRQVDLLREDFDCVVRTEPLHAPGILTRPLGKLTRVNCASPQYLARFGYPENLDDLASHAVGALFIDARSLFTGFCLRNLPRYTVGKNRRNANCKQYGDLACSLSGRVRDHSDAAHCCA
ncbi:LysR family transcripitonal regulator [Salmonella enterica subsp. arizonae]|uniref:LysR family transcripitonal regulator n=1 Tax=Salmonella enterica subsp. arizonae TaxID=59203 RepID=A0A3S4GQH6_SALER|nr:LysR family transcripitonal regulator [Salmonella enterica subsp. arizonae]